MKAFGRIVIGVAATSVAGVVVLSCGAVPDLHFAPEASGKEAGTDASGDSAATDAQQDSPTVDSSSGTDASGGPCPGAPPKSVCCGGVTCIQCKAADCSACAALNCSSGQVCCHGPTLACKAPKDC